MIKKIVLDCLGGDGGITTMLAGAITALQMDTTLQMVLVGDEKIIQPQIAGLGIADRAEIVHTTESIGVDEHPTEAIRKKVNSSIVLGLDKLKTREDCGAFISAGSTGALLTGGFMKIGRIPGVSRPALCPNIPTKTGVPTMLIDCGANVDCKPENLIHFAVMANEYKKASGIAKPKIALLNVGAEETKGNEVVKQTYELLQKLHKKGEVNFVGNIESLDVLNGECDVIVTDGFAGNILLKSLEGVTRFVFRQIKQVLTKGFASKIAGLLVGKKIKKMRADFVEGAQAGSVFLGLKKPVIKAHGNADTQTIASAIMYAKTVVGLDLGDKIESALTKTEKIIGVN